MDFSRHEFSREGGTTMVEYLGVIFALVGAASFENAPVRVEVSLKPSASTTVAQKLKVNITTFVPTVPSNVTLETGNIRRFKLEPPHRALGGLEKLGLKQVEMSVSGQKRGDLIVDSWTYVLEPKLPGEYEIPALSLVFWPTDDSNVPLVVTTDPLPIEVKSILTEDPYSADLKPAAGPMKKSKGGVRWMLVLAVAALWAGTRYYLWKSRQEKGAKLGDTDQSSQSPVLREIEETSDPGKLVRILERFVLAKFGLEITKLSEAEIRAHSEIPEIPRAMLADIKRDLDSAVFAKEEVEVDSGAKQRAIEFIKSLN